MIIVISSGCFVPAANWSAPLSPTSSITGTNRDMMMQLFDSVADAEKWPLAN